MTAGNGYLLHNIVLFNRVLHRLGLDVSPGRTVEMVQAIRLVGVRRREDYYHTLRALLVHRREDIPLFDQAFELFWRAPGEGMAVTLDQLLARPREAPRRTLVLPPETMPEAPPAADPEPAARTAVEVIRTYSQRELLRHKHFAEMDAAELAAVRRLLGRLIWSLGERRTRRLAPGRAGGLDVRRTVRRNLRYGGELLALQRRRRKFKPRPLVIIADTSGSMERYTRLLLHFVYGLSRGLTARVEAFVFSTQLTRITRALQRRELDAALAQVGSTVSDWGGGTRMGDCLRIFNNRWGRRVLRGGAVVLLISDGWDRGDPALLQRQVERLQKTSHRLIWLNPLLGSARYEPLTRGLVAALPYVDDFLPVHNLVSLEALAEHLLLLDRRRRIIRRRPAGAAFIGRQRR